MDEREYIVTVKNGVDWRELHHELCHDTSHDHSVDSHIVPDRTVDVVKEKPNNRRNTHYNLTPEEARALLNDPRIEAVEIPPQKRGDIQIELSASRIGPSRFDTSTIDREAELQWGFLTCHQDNNIRSQLTSSTLNTNQPFVLAGKGVDVVIQDSGINPNHPEFTDSDGNSRVQQIDWYADTGNSSLGTQDPQHYNDAYGHGTHVAGTAAGRYQGWAPEARIYSQKLGGLEGYTGYGYGIDMDDAFDLIRAFHNQKPIDPATGFKRPTVVNMSWGYTSQYINSEFGVHQGVAWDDSNNPGTHRNQYGMLSAAFSFLGGGYRHPIRVASVDAEVEQMVQDGIIVVAAAGNDYHRAYNPGELGYDDWYSGWYWTDYQGLVDYQRYYHRGSSPSHATGVITVGNCELAQRSLGGYTIEKARSSSTGPAVNIWAPGTRILSALPETTADPSDRYGTYEMARLTGTSMASPQVCGYAACILAMRPWMTPAQVLQFIQSNSLSEIGLDGENFDGNAGFTEADYTNHKSGQGSPNRFLKMPFNGGTPFTNTIDLPGVTIRK